MAARHLSPEEAGPFFSRLQRSTLIEIEYYITDLTQQGMPFYYDVLRVPEVLICEFSYLFKILYSKSNKGSFEQDTIIHEGMRRAGYPSARFSDAFSSSFGKFLVEFVKWLYTGDLNLKPNPNAISLTQTWHFAQVLQCPKLMNQALLALCSQLEQRGLGSGLPSQITPILERCWRRCSFFNDDLYGCSLKGNGEVWWGNKKLLKFLLGCVAYNSVKSGTSIHHTKGHPPKDDLTMQIVNSVAEQEQVVRLLTPWHEKNRVNCFVDDDTFQDDNETTATFGFARK